MESGRIETLRQLQRHSRAQAVDWHAYLVQPEISGGSANLDYLDAALDRREITAMTVSGLDQRGLEHLCARYGTQLTAIYFWKCPRISDLSPIEVVSRLTHVAFYWNQRATRLWDLKKTTELQGLQIDDFTRLTDLRDLGSGVSLLELTFGNAVWPTMAVQSLEPLSALRNLRSLRFNPKKILDGSLAPLASLRELTELEFPSNLFSTEQVAWLRARLPTELNSEALKPFRALVHRISRGNKVLDVQVAGKRKPLLSTQNDAEKLRRYVNEFDTAVARYAADPNLVPLA